MHKREQIKHTKLTEDISENCFKNNSKEYSLKNFSKKKFNRI